jgi:hypothetical protein
LAKLLAKAALVEAPADPFHIEGIGADYQRRQHFADQGDSAALGLATPDAGDAGLAQSQPTFLVGQAHQHILSGPVLTQ